MKTQLAPEAATAIPIISALPGTLPREAVGIFPDDSTLTDAIDELLLSGFARCQLGLLARTDGAGSNLGMLVPVEALMDAPDAPRASWHCPEALGDAEGGIMSGFTIIPMFGAAWAAAISGTTLIATTALTLGTGGLGLAAGGALAWYLHHRHAEHLRRQVKAGGLLLWVRTATPVLEETATAILTRHGATHIHVHGDREEALA